ncbi:MAG TPA: hypothetical protein DCR93_38890 [Cytophagales bacterium]|nr:hypothetical protein [Cytophagales bacterium]
MDTLNEAPAEIQLAYIVQTSLPLWNKNLSLLAQMEDMTGLPKEHLTPLKMWRQYIDLRMKAGQLKIQNLRHVPPIEWDRELEEYEVRYQQIQPF